MNSLYRTFGIGTLLALTPGCGQKQEYVTGTVTAENETDSSISTKYKQTYVIVVETPEGSHTISVEPGKTSLKGLEAAIQVGSQVKIKRSALDTELFRKDRVGIIYSEDITVGNR